MRKIIAIIAVMILLVAAGWTALAYYGVFSDGYRVGVITKFSRKGFVFKTFEGELDQGYLKPNGPGIGSNIFYFSVENRHKDVLDSINVASDKGLPIKLYYKERYWKLPFLGETKYFILKGEPIHTPTNRNNLLPNTSTTM